MLYLKQPRVLDMGLYFWIASVLHCDDSEFW